MVKPNYKAWYEAKGIMLTVVNIYWNPNGKWFVNGIEDNGTHYQDLSEKDVKLLQYTGRKDNNYIEVYNRDIIKCGNEVHVVSWMKDTTGWFPFASMIVRIQEDLHELGFECIGNIYQNEDMLK